MCLKNADAVMPVRPSARTPKVSFSDTENLYVWELLDWTSAAAKVARWSKPYGNRTAASNTRCGGTTLDETLRKVKLLKVANRTYFSLGCSHDCSIAHSLTHIL